MQLCTTRLQVRHVNVKGFKARFGERIGHLDMRVHALLSQHGHARAGEHQRRTERTLRSRFGDMHMQTWVKRVACRCVLGVGAGGVVAQLANLPAGAVPDLMQVLQLGCEDQLGIAPNLHITNARLDCGFCGTGFADEMAVLAQTVVAQSLHDCAALHGAHLQEHTQLLVEQGFECQLFPSRTHLARPVFAITHLGSAVGNAVAFGDQQVHIERNTDVACKCHLTRRSEQATVAAIMVGQQLALATQLVDGFDQVHEVLRIVQIRHLIAELIQSLRQDTATHAVFAASQIDQHQRGVKLGRVELRCECAAHVGQCGERGDDQADGTGDFFVRPFLFPLRAHRQ